MAVVHAADKEGNDVFINIKYKCKICGDTYDEESEAKDCFEICIEEEYGSGVEEIQVESDPDDYVDEEQ